MNQRISVVILTGDNLRHTFFRRYLSLDPKLKVLTTVCEKKINLQLETSANRTKFSLVRNHLQRRQQVENDFFLPFVHATEDYSNPQFVEQHALNRNYQLQASLRDLNPDVVVCFGTSIIREPLLSDFNGRFLNIHLGLSPYYRGGGTNFWPLVNREPEFIGVTFMHIDSGVDTGQVVHQIRARLREDDTPHTLGNRLIGDLAAATVNVITNFGTLPRVAQAHMNPLGRPERVYRRRDFSEDAVATAQNNLRDGMLSEYLEDKEARDLYAPIVEQVPE